MALYGITSSSQIIDIQGIKAACAQITAAAEDFQTAANKVAEGKEYAAGDALRVDGKTMEESFDIVKGALENVKQNIDDYVDSVIQTANSIYVAQSQELAEYQAKQAAEQNN